VRLTPTERDRLLLFTAAQLARERRGRGLLLNIPEATAIVADTVAEAARDGARLVDSIQAGQHVLDPDAVLPGVREAIPEVWVEAVFDDGTRLVVVPDPIGGPASDAPYPGQVITDSSPRAAVGPVTSVVPVTNTATVPISVTSHFHFFEVNPRLRFDRAEGYGRHLAMPAGASVRFEPGQTRRVQLTEIGGARVVVGFAGLVDGPLDAPGAKEQAMARARATGYLDSAAGELP
jgi:urease subunit gamma/beta